jgi:Fe-S-cluster containining protein
MDSESIFLTAEQALKAVQLDFRGYGPQPMLFCGVLRLLFGENMIYQREIDREGLWIARKPQRMRWFEGAELIDFMCRVLNAAELPPDRLAALCRLVFQAPCEPDADPETGRAGVRIRTGMDAFNCRQCGGCCRKLTYHDGMTEDDVNRLRALGRTDILEWVGVTQTADGRPAYRIWVTPGTNRFALPCPFLKQGDSNDRWLCSIHDVKPQICRNYPVSRKHAMMTGCPGFGT